MIFIKNKIKYIIIFLGLILFVLSVVSVAAVNFNFGIVIIFVVSCVFIIYGLFYDRLIKIRLLSYCILSICIALLVFTLFIYFYGKNDNVTFGEDAVIVLGASVRGEEVSLLLSYRLDKAAEYHLNNPGAVIVVSGGQGFQEDITEADAMERYLIDKGVSGDMIVKEAAATSTYENLLFSKEILDKLFGDSYETVVITNDFHVFRATSLARKLGYNVTHYNAKTDWYAMPVNYSREFLAIVKMWVLGR